MFLPDSGNIRRGRPLPRVAACAALLRRRSSAAAADASHIRAAGAPSDPNTNEAGGVQIGRKA
jgi:hypothetical protein